MVVAMDGGMVHIRGEGWKEAKIAAVSAVETRGGGSEEPTVRLNLTSYRTGLWDAARFANQQWAEGCRRGLEKAQRVVCVNDGALWIWLVVAMCYAPRCVEILDWWHAVQKLWELAFTILGQENTQSQDWAEEQTSLLWSACKLVMQERMKQAGMRWTRTGAQAMFALHSVLLSQRWQEVCPSLDPPPKLA